MILRSIFIFIWPIVFSWASQNVMFIVVDDLRPFLGVYKESIALTPNIDQIANLGYVFNRTYSQQALCAPSRNSMLTSRYPDSVGLYDFYSYWRTFSGNFTTLPQYFKSHGYITHSIGKVFHPGISSNNSDDMPYSWTLKPYHPPTESFKMAKVCKDSDGSKHMNLVCPVNVSEQPGRSLPDIESTEESIRFIKTQRNSRTSKPFFLGLGLHKPHIPLKFPAKYLDLYPINDVPYPNSYKLPKNLPVVAWNPWTDLRLRHDVELLNVSFPFGPLNKDFGQQVRQSYLACVTYIDDLLGKVFQTLSDEKLLKETIIVLLGDHGWSLGENQEWSKYGNFQVATRVPLIIFDPKAVSDIIFKYISPFEVQDITESLMSPGPRVVPCVTELVDVFPTLVDLANLPPMPSCLFPSTNISFCTEGRSLKPLMIRSAFGNPGEISHQCMGWKTVARTQYPRPSGLPDSSPNFDKPRLNQIDIMGYSVVTLDYRYTEWVRFNRLSFLPQWDGLIAAELYDTNRDPWETLNVIDVPHYNQVKRELRLQLRSGRSKL